MKRGERELTEDRYRDFTWRSVGDDCVRVCVHCAEETADPTEGSRFQFVMSKAGKKYLMCLRCGAKEELR